LQEIQLPEDVQKERRKGVDKGMMVFNKSRKRLSPRISSQK
jgi:hypothetical protein